MYATIFGTIGALLPIPSRDTLHQMNHIEMFLRKQEPSLVGRDLLSWRSAYTPMKVSLLNWICIMYNNNNTIDIYS